jgi:hypothetical protein
LRRVGGRVKAQSIDPLRSDSQTRGFAGTRIKMSGFRTNQELADNSGVSCQLLQGENGVCEKAEARFGASADCK